MSQPLIYLDSCVVIYVVERHPLYAATIEARMQGMTRGTYCHSPLVRMECLIKPLRNQDADLQQLFETFWRAQKMLDLPISVYDSAAKLRAVHPHLKTPDALHLAAAQHHGCGEFWTNDDRLAIIAPALARKVI